MYILSRCCKTFVIYISTFLITLKYLRVPERDYFTLRFCLRCFKIETNIILKHSFIYALFECTNLYSNKRNGKIILWRYTTSRIYNKYT